MGNEIGNDNAYHSRRFLAQALCKRIGTVVQSLGQCIHFRLHFLAHLMAVAQGTRYCCDAHAQFFGQIFQRSSTLLHSKINTIKSYLQTYSQLTKLQI